MSELITIIGYRSELVILTSVSCIDKCIKKFSGFLTRHLKNIIAQLCLVRSAFSDSVTICTKIQLTKKHLNQAITVQVLMQQISDTYRIVKGTDVVCKIFLLY